MAASFGVVFLVLMLVVSSGVAFSAPLGGIGGFTIKADRIEGDDLYQYVSVSDTSKRAGIPVAVAEFTEIRIEGLQLMKEFEGVPAIGGNARIVITSTGTVTADSLLIKQSYIYAEKSTFSGLLIDEQPSDDITEQFRQVAPSTGAERHSGMDQFTNPQTINLSGGENPGQVFVNATIQAHYQAVNEIHIPGLTLAAEYDANGDGDYTDEGDISLGG
ncbi:MAG TPA: DUF6230 family protein [Halococcus sp.]|nr:DUF6230 family protein [Halococcus sp.]